MLLSYSTPEALAKFEFSRFGRQSNAVNLKYTILPNCTPKKRVFSRALCVSVFQNEDKFSIPMSFKYLETQSHRGHERGSTALGGNLSLN